MITFTVINLSVNAVHGNLHLPRAFNFGSGIDGILDAVYFSIITRGISFPDSGKPQSK